MILIHHLFEVAEDYNTTSNTGVSDVWGYTDETGIEYAIVGYCYGTFIYDVSSNPDSPTLVADISGPSNGDYYFHRDYKTFGNYLYIVNEMDGADQGMQIVDLSPLPNGAPIHIETYTGINKSHNLWIDESSGYGFIENSHPENIHIVDLSNPAVPVPVVGGFWNSDGQGCHDIYTENNMAYISEGSDFSIYDISNISDPLLVTTIPSFGYAHNAWLNSAGTHLITGEETVGMTLKIWDIQQIENINMVGEYLGENSLVHNVHVKGDFVFISHYTTGLKIIDIFNPTDPIEVAAYDTYPDDDNPGFYGCWGAYPFTLNNYVFASDIQYGLFVFEFDNIKAGWIYGNIAAWTTGGMFPLAGIELKSLLNEKIFTTDSNGNYSFGFPEGEQEFEIYYNGEVEIVTLSIIPHDYTEQNISLNIALGDLNEDGVLNIQDVIKMINCILGIDECPPQADMNSDDIINVLDIVSLVNIILS